LLAFVLQNGRFESSIPIDAEVVVDIFASSFIVVIVIASNIINFFEVYALFSLCLVILLISGLSVSKHLSFLVCVFGEKVCQMDCIQMVFLLAIC
jgi:hypothetical protein